jgi:hypothetical protein
LAETMIGQPLSVAPPSRMAVNISFRTRSYITPVATPSASCLPQRADHFRRETLRSLEARRQRLFGDAAARRI